MKIYVPMALAVLIVVSAWGRAVVPAALPPAVHADTETVTNVPFAAALDVAGRRALPWARGSGRRHVCVRGRGRRPRRPAYTRAFPMAFALARRAGPVRFAAWASICTGHARGNPLNFNTALERFHIWNRACQ